MTIMESYKQWRETRQDQLNSELLQIANYWLPIMKNAGDRATMYWDADQRRREENAEVIRRFQAEDQTNYENALRMEQDCEMGGHRIQEWETQCWCGIRQKLNGIDRAKAVLREKR